MKKVLFATTALIATAGVASAQGVTLSGSAEMGIYGGDMINFGTGVVTARNTQFHTDIDVTFTMSGTTDNGLTFGASVDLDESDGAGAVGASAAFAANTQGGETIFLSGNFGTVTMGDTDGAFDWAMNEVPGGPGSLQDDETSHAGFNGNAGLDGTYDGQILRYDNTFGAFGIAVSAEIDDTTGAAQGDPVIGIGLRYNLNLGGSDMEIAIGHQQTSTAANVDSSVTGISLDTTISGLNVGLNYSVMQNDAWVDDQSHVAIGVGYSMDAISFGLNYGVYDNLGGVAANDRNGIGFSAGYDLGGGASLLLGYGYSEVNIGAVSTNVSEWSFGVSMSF
ncbi:porin [Nioella nitratireducens]|uniref:porin n=1 Tax=Nioella nitratireducens TaxID=1287720 RepID=UPI0008FD65AC|nr:porin [Nioella nitratireducens]